MEAIADVVEARSEVMTLERWRSRTEVPGVPDIRQIQTKFPANSGGAFPLFFLPFSETPPCSWR
jgi:hypothetical protein